MNIDEAEQIKTELIDGACRYSSHELLDMLIEALAERDAARENNVILASTARLAIRQAFE